MRSLSAIDALSPSIETLKNVAEVDYRVLLTIIPPKPNREGDEARELLTDADLPVMQSSIVSSTTVFGVLSAFGVRGILTDERVALRNH